MGTHCVYINPRNRRLTRTFVKYKSNRRKQYRRRFLDQQSNHDILTQESSCVVFMLAARMNSEFRMHEVRMVTSFTVILH